MNDVTEAHITALLTERGIAHEYVSIDPDHADTAVFCERYGYALEDSANTIVVASKKPAGHHVACVVLATTRLDVNKAVRSRMGVRRASFANAEQMRNLTGMQVGGVTPFGLPDDLPIWIDAAVMTRSKVIIGAGSRAGKLIVAPQALASLPLAEIVDGIALPV